MTIAHKLKVMHSTATRRQHRPRSSGTSLWGMPFFCLMCETFRSKVLECTGLGDHLRLCNATDFGVVYEIVSNRPIAGLTMNENHEMVLGPYVGTEGDPLYKQLERAVYAVAREIDEEWRQ